MSKLKEAASNLIGAINENIVITDEGNPHLNIQYVACEVQDVLLAVQEPTVLEEMMRFQSERGLHKREFNVANEQANIFEELMEVHGLDTPKENRSKLMGALAEFKIKLITDGVVVPMEKGKKCTIDPYNDIMEFCTGAIMKQDIHPEDSLSEMAMEINSRKGRVIDGKFEKYLKGEEGYEKPYQADYTNCRKLSDVQKN